MSIDTVGGFGGNGSKKKYMHILIDHFSRYVWVHCSKYQTANEFITLIKKVTKNNQINRLLVDQYAGLNSAEFKSFLKDNKIKLIFTPVDNPSSNGMNERVNQTLVNRLRCKLDDQSKKAWTKTAEEAVEEYNRTEHSITNYTPDFLLNGIQEKFSPLEEEIDLDKAKEDAVKRTLKSNEKNKVRIDKMRIDKEIKVGDWVYVEAESKLNRSKLKNVRIGPVEVVKKISPLIYQLKTGKKKKENNLFHKNRLIVIS